MKWIIIIILLLPVLSITAQNDQKYETAGSDDVRFGYIDVYMDPAGKGLSAYQFELKAVEGTIEIVGVEGGDHPAFSKPPYYDPQALSHDRIIIAAYTTGTELPVSNSRIARIHIQVSGEIEPEYTAVLQASADKDGNGIETTITIQKGE